MLKIVLIAILPFLLFYNNSSTDIVASADKQTGNDSTGTLKKMVVSGGGVTLDLDLRLLTPSTRTRGKTPVTFSAGHDSLFTVVVFNDELRGPIPGTLGLMPAVGAPMPEKLQASYNDLIIERMPFDSDVEFTVRDGKTGFVFFNIEGIDYGYDAAQSTLTIRGERVLISPEFAASLGRRSDAGTVVGSLTLTANMRTIEITKVVDGEVTSSVLPATGNPDAGTVPGPDVVVGDLIGVQQGPGGFVGGYVGLGIGTTSCNFGTVNLNWYSLSSGTTPNDHPVIPQNLYRMSGGATNDERFEQIGQSWLKHAFTALTQDICNLGCNGTGGTRLGSGCSDPYSASLNYNQDGLGSRAWVNPFTGVFPTNPSPANHTGHAHNGPSHRVLVAVNDLLAAQNPGATYYAEGQYVTPHEYAHCQANPGQCNMNNNVSYRRYNVSGTTSFSFASVGTTQRQKTALSAWTGATSVKIEPAPGTDGIGEVGYKVTNPSPGVWHYEYAVYNQNIDRGVQSFSVPVGAGASLSNIGFHAPPQHPGWANDGTFNSQGYSGTPWAESQANGAMTWNSETFAQNQNANAIRWGTMYNFRFDSNRPPTLVNATIGFYKTGQPIVVQIQGPSAANASVSGRVTSTGGRGVTNAIVTIETAGGTVIGTGITNRNGNYVINNIPMGATYTIRVTARRFTFTPNTMQISDNVTNADFVAN